MLSLRAFSARWSQPTFTAIVPGGAGRLNVTVDATSGAVGRVVDRTASATLDSLVVFSETATVRSGSWPAIQAAFPGAMRGKVPDATYLYARPNGSYWVAGEGLQSATIADRGYFKQAISGKNAVGEIVLGRSVGNVVAVVAVPVRDASGKIVGIVGAGIDLVKLTAILTKEMGIAGNAVFWATDANGITALHSDPANIFNDALKVPELKSALQHMIATDSGVETYAFKGKTRTVLFRHSTLTGWTYGFGVIH